MQDQASLEKMLGDVQIQNQQLQSLLVQKQTLTLQVREAERALEELEKAKDDTDVFKAAGPILLKTSKAESTKELTELKEEMDIRIKTIEIVPLPNCSKPFPRANHEFERT